VPASARAACGRACDSPERTARRAVNRAGVRPATVAALAAAPLAFAAYLATLNRTFGYVDEGELAAVAATLGIAHPTGYPLVTLIGRVAVALVPLRPVLALNLLAAALTATGAAVLVKLYDHVLAAADAPPRPRPLDPALRAVVAGAAALATVWTGFWWEQGTAFEVYALHALLMPLVVLLALRTVRELADSDALPRTGPVFAYVLGLAFANHLTTVLLAPALLVHALAHGGAPRRLFVRLAQLAPWTLLGLTPYLVLPLRARLHPALDWGAPVDVVSLFRHVTGREYSGWMFEGATTFLLQTRYFLSVLPADTGVVGVGLAVVGIAWLAQRSGRHAWIAVLLIAASVAYAGQFGIMEIRPYYLTAMLGLGFGMAAGLGWIASRVPRPVALALAALLPAALVAANFRVQDARRLTLAEDQARDLLDGLPPHAVILSAQWEQWLSGSLYLQNVEHLRPDVTVVDQETVRLPWYLDALARREPLLTERAAPAIAAYRAKTNAGRPLADEHAVFEMQDALIAAAAVDRPVFVTRDVPPAVGAAWRRVPQGLAIRLVAPSDTAEVAMPWPPAWRLGGWRRPDYLVAKTCELYARSAIDRAWYEAQHGHDALALRWLATGRAYDPGWDRAGMPPLPWRGDEMMGASVAFFEQLRSTRDDAFLATAKAAVQSPPR